MGTIKMHWERKAKKTLSPLQPGADCEPASPAGHGQRDTGPGRSHTQTNLVEHSGRNKRTTETRESLQYVPCLLNPQAFSAMQDQSQPAMEQFKFGRKVGKSDSQKREIHEL